MIGTSGSAPWTEGCIDVDGVSLHFHRTGDPDRTPLVLAHGLSDNGRCWTRVADALGDRFDIVMPDARNHGNSATATTSLELLVDDIVAIVAALGLEQPAMIGHSVGAHTVASLAALHPAMVSRVVLEDPPWTAAREHASTESSDDVRAQLSAWLSSYADMSDGDILQAGRRQHADWPEQEFPPWVESNRQVRANAADGLPFTGWGPTVAAISCPTLLVHGEVERGALVTPLVADRITRGNPHIRAQHVEHAGHNIRRENFQRFIDVVGDFLTVDERT